MLFRYWQIANTTSPSDNHLPLVRRQHATIGIKTKLYRILGHHLKPMPMTVIAYHAFPLFSE